MSGTNPPRGPPAAEPAPPWANLTAPAAQNPPPQPPPPWATAAAPPYAVYPHPGQVPLMQLPPGYPPPLQFVAGHPQPLLWAIPPPPGFQFNASEITIRHLLSMRSGIRDSDTAAFRHTQYTHPNVDFSPLDLLDISHGPLMFKPGGPVPSHGGHHPHMHMNFNYCSINFVLLGLVLAHFSGSKTWAEYDQSSILPRSTHGSVRFPQSGPCSQYTNVHGYDEASNYAPFDVSPISCLAGWTAGNVVMPVQAAANWTYSLYATEEVLPSKYVAMMVPGPHQEIYGLATFNFSGRYANGTEGRAWGHLGDTYGFTSIIAYFPNISMGLAVATNVEGSEQTAPREVLCVVYNRLLDWVRGRSEARTCRYIHVSFYLSGCQCSA